MPKSTDPDAALLHALADPTGPAIVRHLATNSQVCACDFAARNDLAQPIRSHDLWVLREARVVRGERRGKWISPGLQPGVPERLRALGDELLPAEPRPASADAGWRHASRSRLSRSPDRAPGARGRFPST
jgi:ArsR family transcriptional regulator